MGLYQTPMQTFLEVVKIVLIALIIALGIRTFLLRPFVIPSGSMLKTLQPGDRIFVNMLSYGIHLPFGKRAIVSFDEPERGDIVVFPFPGDPSEDYIKRVVGVAGDVIEMRDKQLYRNGALVHEDYVIHSSPYTVGERDFTRPITVPEGKLFVMGDNRDDSKDSRFWGFVDKDTVYGRAVIIYWSSINYTNISWDRIGTILK